MPYTKNHHLYPAWMKAAVDYYATASELTPMMIPYETESKAKAMRFRFYAYIKLVGMKTQMARIQLRVVGNTLVLEPYVDSEADRRALESVFAQMTAPRTIVVKMPDGGPVPDKLTIPNVDLPPAPPKHNLGHDLLSEVQTSQDEQLRSMGFSEPPQTGSDSAETINRLKTREDVEAAIANGELQVVERIVNGVTYFGVKSEDVTENPRYARTRDEAIMQRVAKE